MKKYFKELQKTLEISQTNDSLIENIEKVTKKMEFSLLNGGKILVAGNGGSAADAQHFTAELVGRYKKERQGYPAIALTTDTSIITAWSNDYNFNSLFSRQIKSLGNKNDVFLGISTSGNSENVIRAVEVAKNKNIFTVGLLGSDGGKMKNAVDLPLVIPSNNTPRIQEVHGLLLHIIAEEIENNITKND